MVYPGGDLDAMRPYSKRAQADFGGRLGYARLAARAKVPIVPIVDVGGHEQSIVLFRSEWLAKFLDLPKKFRLKGLPITVRSLPFLPWLFHEKTQEVALTGLMAASSIPLPAKMDFYFESPISLSEYEQNTLSLEQQAKLLNERTLKALNSRLEEGYSKRRLPLIGDWAKVAGS